MFQLVTGMVVLFITARLLGAEGRGLFVAVTTWAVTLSTLGGLSLDRVLMHKGAEAISPAWAAPAAAAALWYVGLASGAGALAALGLYVWSPGLFGEVPVSLLAAGLLIVPLLMWTEYAAAILTSSGGLSSVNRARVMGSGVYLTTVVLLVWSLRLDVPGAIASAVASYAVTGGLMYGALRRTVPGTWRFSWSGLKAMTAQGAKLHLNTAGNLLRSQIDILMLNVFLTPTAVGIYQMGSRLVDTLLVVPSAAGMAFYEEMGRTSPNAVWPSQKRTLVQLTVLMVVTGGLAYLAAPIVIPLVAGEEFRQSVTVFRLLLPILIGKAVGSVISTQVIGRGWFWEASLVGICVAALNVLMNYLLIPLYGINGAIMGTLASYAGLPLVAGLWWGIRIDRQVRRARAEAVIPHSAPPPPGRSKILDI